MSKTKSKLKFLHLYTKSRILPPLLSMATIFVTRRCNRECDYCYTKKDYNPEEELSLEEVKEVIDKFKEFGVWYLAFYGGEPALRSDLPDMVKYAHNKGMFTSIHTNGSFNNFSIDDLVNSGVDIVDIAIDSMSDPKFKNHEEVKGTLRDLVYEHDVGVKLNFCIFKENYKEIADILKLTEDYEIPITIRLGTTSPLPTDASYDSTLFFKRGDKGDIEQVREISELLANRARKRKFIINPPEYFLYWPIFMREEELKWKCNAGNSLCVDYNGAILQCINATFPVKIDGQVLYYRNLTRANINFVKQEVQKLTEQCSPQCLSCAYMLVDSMRNLSMSIKAIRSF